jgi:hypothetical protein
VNNTKLLQLHLAGNRLATIPANLLQKNTVLQYLDLSFNLLTNLNKTMFSSNTLLETIELNDNKLNALDAQMFKNLTKLRTLLLSDNICIDTDFTSNSAINGTDVTTALFCCNANMPSCKSYASQISTLITLLNTALPQWTSNSTRQNVTAILTQFKMIPIS